MLHEFYDYKNAYVNVTWALWLKGDLFHNCLCKCYMSSVIKRESPIIVHKCYMSPMIDWKGISHNCSCKCYMSSMIDWKWISHNCLCKCYMSWGVIWLIERGSLIIVLCKCCMSSVIERGSLIIVYVNVTHEFNDWLKGDLS
jgi:hypothetical protein